MSDKFAVAPLEKFFDESTPGLRKKDGIFYTPHYAAAAMTDDFSALNVKELQDVLQRSGVVLHENELEK